MKFRLQRTLAPQEWRRRLVFWGGALLTGAVAVLFAEVSTYAMLAFKDVRLAHPLGFPCVATPLGLAAAACGALLALIGWLSASTTYGTGYDEAKVFIARADPAVR